METTTKPRRTLTEHLEAKLIPVIETFGPTIQGEGAVIGLPTYFIRFGLCDYKCKMCDSMHAVDGKLVNENALWLSQEDIFKAIMLYRISHGGDNTTDWITFSGGNPLVHDLSLLVQLLDRSDMKIAVETQGTIFKDWLYGCDHITISPKGPGMGEKTDLDVLDTFMEHMLDVSPSNYSMKVVIFDQRDIEFAAMLHQRYVSLNEQLYDSQFFLSLGNSWPPGHVETGHYHLHERLTAKYLELLPDVLNNQTLRNVKFLPQWHVMLWGNKQGV